MKLLNQYRDWKNHYEKYIILCKCGNFYDVLEEDTKVIAYLMNYKINEYNGIPKLGFPVISLKKVLKELEQARINYLVFEKIGEEYQVVMKKRFINNQYEGYLQNLEQYRELKNQVEEVCDLLNEQLLKPGFQEKIEKIRAIL